MGNPCYAHRGWSSKAPENTMSAIRLAIEHPKIQGIEFDVQMSSDGVPIVIHDFTLDRTTTGKGYVKDYKWKELRTYDAGSWFGTPFRGEKIPTLEEVLHAVKGKLKLNMELKKAGNMYPGLEQRVVDLIRTYKMEDDIVITSFNHFAVQKVSQITKKIRTGLLTEGVPVLLDEQLKATGATVLSMHYPYLTKSFVTTYLNQGVEIIAWTVDNPIHIEELAALDERIAICTNYPEHMPGIRN